MADPEAADSPLKPGWMRATDWEDDGVSVATSVHAFYQTLCEREPAMPKALINRLTEKYLANFCGDEPDDEL